MVEFSPIILGQDPEFDKIMERGKNDMKISINEL